MYSNMIAWIFANYVGYTPPLVLPSKLSFALNKYFFQNSCHFLKPKEIWSNSFDNSLSSLFIFPFFTIRMGSTAFTVKYGRF